MTALEGMRSIKQAMGIDTEKDDRIFQMSSQQLNRRIRNACTFAGLKGRYGGHSPRIGMAMDLAMAAPPRNPAGHQPVPGGRMTQTVSPSAPLPGAWRLLVETGPFDAIPDVPQRTPHRQSHHLVPRRPASRPVREALHQIRMQAHRTSAPALRLPDEQSRRLAQVIEIPPFKSSSRTSETRRPVRHMISAAVRA